MRPHRVKKSLIGALEKDLFDVEQIFFLENDSSEELALSLIGLLLFIEGRSVFLCVIAFQILRV